MVYTYDNYIVSKNVLCLKIFGSDYKIIFHSAVDGDACNGGVVYTTHSGSATTPGWKADGSGTYSNDLRCSWTILVSAGYVSSLDVSTSVR